MRRGALDLIAELTAAPAPVRRLAPPMVRALVWLAAIAVVCGGAVLGLSNLAVFAHRAAEPRLAAELAFTLATGVSGVIGAFHVSLPDRSRAWAFLPLPFAVAWLALSGAGCWRFWSDQTTHGWRLADSSGCFLFLLGAGIPIAGVLLLALRRAAPLQPRLTALVGAAGVAGIAGFLLQFFHPFDVTIMDLGAHLAALAVLIGVFSLSAGRTLET